MLRSVEIEIGSSTTQIESKSELLSLLFGKLRIRDYYTIFHFNFVLIVRRNHKRWAARMMPHFNCWLKSVKLLIKNAKKWLNRAFFCWWTTREKTEKKLVLWNMRSWFMFRWATWVTDAISIVERIKTSYGQLIICDCQLKRRNPKLSFPLLRLVVSSDWVNHFSYCDMQILILKL